MEASPDEACCGGIRTFPHSRRDHPPGWENGLSGALGPAPLQVEVPRFVEPAKLTTTPVTSTVHHDHTSMKGIMGKDQCWSQQLISEGSNLFEEG